ncbi:MAG: hypothetical protein H0U46_05050 [Actinobacteria bacterium]|nr:hypothetical protein [Actinomycetota bacterium]
MAATHAPAKSRKQLYIVIGLGAVFAVLLAIQLPKYLGGGSEAAPTTTTDSLPTSTIPAPPGPVNASGSGAVVGGVNIVPGVVTEPGEGQLASFSLFDRRDPFVQVVKEPAVAGSQDGEPVGVKVSGGGKPAGSGSASGGAGTDGTTAVSAGQPGSVAAAPSGLSAATIWVNGADESVAVKKRFPKTDPTFVLLSLKPRVATLGVVGGAFTGGGTITLKMGQTLTLVNTATGARYTLRLLYTGSQPEQVQQFTQAEN